MIIRLTIFLFFLLSFKSNSQDGLVFRKIEIPNLLTENINSIFVDNRGFNWISTEEGLVRYDGINSTFFRSNPFDENTISDNSIKNVFQADSDGVFISTQTGLDYFDYNKLLFKRIESSATPTSNYKFSNFLFTSTENQGLFIYDLKKDTIIENLKFDPRNPLSISSSNFSSNQNDNIILIAEKDRDSTLWIGTTNGLNNYNLKTKSNKRFYKDNSRESISSNFIYDLYSFDSLLFVGTDQGISTINRNNNSINEIDFLKNSQVYNIFEISGNLCFHTSKGIYKLKNLFTNSFEEIYSGKQLNLKVINNNEFVVWNTLSKIDRIFYYNDKFQTQLLSNGSSQKINDINNFKGAYYISTNEGINKITEDLKNISKVYTRDENIIAVKENDFFRVIMTDKFLLVYEEEEVVFSFELDIILKDQDRSNPVIFLDEDEYLYVGTNKLNVIDLYEEDDIRVYETSAGFNSILEGDINNLEIITRNNVKELWISLNTGISIFNVEQDRFENFKFNQRSSRNRFPEGFSSILLSRNNELWMANSVSGLYKYEIENLDLIKHYIFDINDKTSITSSSITSISEYNDEIYVGSKGDGVFVYSNDSIGFQNINTDNGLLSNNIISFLKTYQFLFILTDRGINYFDFEVISSLTDGNNNNLRNINNDDGLDINGIINSGITFYNDFVYLFTNDEIQKIDLYNLFEDNESPIINLTESEYIDQNFDRKRYDITESKINLSSDISNIELSLSSPSFYKPQSSQIFYKIEELNDQWINLGNERKLIIQSSGYSNSFVNDNKILAPYGEYNLRIKSTNSSGIESSNQLEYNLSVTPPWYLTTIAFISYFLIIVGSIFTYVRFSQGRTRRLMEEKRKEEELEEAHNLQMGLLAKENPKREDLDISTFIRCATEVGGDYYDFIEFEDGSLLAICGDATGHGTASGMMVSITKAGLLGIDSSDPNFILKTLNKIIKKVDIGRLRMSLNLVHFQNGSIKMSSAAMPPMYHYEKKNNKVDEITISNLPLGGLMSENFTVLDKKFAKDDVLVMLSDGLPEAPNKDGELLDYAAVKECIEKHSTKTASEIKDELVKLSDKWMNGIHNPDDITIVVCKKLKN